MPRVTLVGYRGSGKSTVAPRLAEMLGCSWLDADLVLEQELGTTIAAVVAERGELFFRDREADLLERMLAERHGVLATGGGVVLRPANRKLLANGGRPVQPVAIRRVVDATRSQQPSTSASRSTARWPTPGSTSQRSRPGGLPSGSPPGWPPGSRRPPRPVRS